MNSDPRLLFFCRDDGLMNITAIHALSAIFGQQSRMYIDDPPPVSGDQCCRDLPQKAGQHEKIDLPFLQLRHIGPAPEKCLLFDHQHRDTRSFGNAYHPGSRFVTNDQ